MDQCRRFVQAFCRRKTVDPKKLLISRFKRSLNIFDLLGIGIGGSLGMGVFVVITYVIKHQAGPSAVISVIIAGVAAFLSGLCYSEFSTRFPQTGSSYVYVYASLGELSAFVVGWSMISENILLAATAAKAWSQYFDGLLNNTISSYIENHMHLYEEDGLSSYPDVLSCGVLLLLGLLFLFTSKVSTVFNLILTVLNILVIFCVICVGIFHVRHENWTDPPGFFPFGFPGVVSGAATIFCLYTVIDSICSSSEETKEPIKIVPSSVITTNALCFVFVLCVTLSITLSYPWYNLSDSVAIPQAYKSKGIQGSFYVFSVGGLIGTSTAIVASLYGIQRFLFSMKTDRLLFPCCLNTSGELRGWKITIVPVFLSCVLSTFLTLNILMQVLALGTLVTYTCVAICVINTRYQPLNIGLCQEYEEIGDDKSMQSTNFVYASLLTSAASNKNDMCRCVHNTSKNGLFKRFACDTDNKLILSGKPRDSTYQKMESVVNDTPEGSQSSLYQLPVDVPIEATTSSSMTSAVALIVFILASTIFCFLVTFANDSVLCGAWWAIASILISVIILIVTTVVIVKQPQNQATLFFKTPYVPFVPLLSIFTNMLLLSSLSYKAWIRFSAWLGIGLIVYFCYGIRHSTEKDIDEQEVVLYEITEHEQTAIK